MKRIPLTPRPNWQQRLEEAGCQYHTIDGQPYWNETAAYEFTSREIDQIEAATQELHSLCIEHCRRTVEEGDYHGYGFPDEVREIVEQSWNKSSYEGDHLMGRMDLGVQPGPDGLNLKLYEYNADTPTALPEASVWQWHALEDRGWPDQYNSVHETLVDRWKRVLLYGDRYRHVHFTAHSEGRHEDWGNLNYMIEVATEAGAPRCTSLPVEKIGWNGQGFTNLNEEEISLLFKLYPWEWMMADEFGWKVAEAKTKFVEPPWKMLLSTKALLPRLWARNPNHEFLLEAHFGRRDGGNPPTSGGWVRKPMLGREGSNIAIHGVQTLPAEKARGPHDAQYDKHGYIWQRFWPSWAPDNYHVPVLGSWVIGNKACGLGIREEQGAITTNASQFVPHYFVD